MITDMDWAEPAPHLRQSVSNETIQQGPFVVMNMELCVLLKRTSLTLTSFGV